MENEQDNDWIANEEEALKRRQSKGIRLTPRPRSILNEKQRKEKADLEAELRLEGKLRYEITPKEQAKVAKATVERLREDFQKRGIPFTDLDQPLPAAKK